MKTKVWLVIWGLKDGGAEVLAREYARLADKEQFDTTIVTMYPFETTANYRCAKEAQLKVVSIFKKRNIVTRLIRAFVGNWYVPHVLKGMMRKDQPDAIHFNSQMASYFTTLKKQFIGVKLLYSCHSEASKYFNEKEEDAVRQLIHESGLRLIALHEDMKRELNERFTTDDTVVIRNGIDMQRFRNVKNSKNETLQKLGISQDAYVVGHIGRFSKAKNHAFLLQIFHAIVARNKKAHLLLIGNGELQEQITQTINQLHLENRVTILSHRTDIPDLLQAMDVMVFPSLFEGLSVTLVEAQATGLRCVISSTINPANHLSEDTISVGLAESAEVWADVVLNDTIKNKEYGNIEDYDMNKEIHRLECLYRGELNA